MNVGDRVRHKRLGLGTVKALYPKNNAARVLYDSGHETTNAQSRIRVIQLLSEAPPPAAEPKRRRRRDPGVDYDLIERAVRETQAAYPEADEVVGKVFGGRAYCEVYKNGRADIVFYDD